MFDLIVIQTQPTCCVFGWQSSHGFPTISFLPCLKGRLS